MERERERETGSCIAAMATTKYSCVFDPDGSGFRVQGSGFRVQGSGFRVQGPLVDILL